YARNPLRPEVHRRLISSGRAASWPDRFASGRGAAVVVRAPPRGVKRIILILNFPPAWVERARSAHPARRPSVDSLSPQHLRLPAASPDAGGGAITSHQSGPSSQQTRVSWLRERRLAENAAETARHRSTPTRTRCGRRLIR